MKCDDFLPYLETGGMVRPLLARWHAVRCPRCAAVYDAWNDAKRHWASPEPLSSRLRRLWQQSAPEVEEVPTLRWWTASVAAAAASLLMCAIVWTLWTTHSSKGRIDPDPEPRQLASEVDTSVEFASLETQVSQLHIEIAALMPQTELLDARLQASDILNRYSKW